MNKKVLWVLFAVLFFSMTSMVCSTIEYKWMVFNKIEATLGPLNDGWVYDVIPQFEQKPYSITISVCCQDKANAMASILKSKYGSGGNEITLFIKVKGSIPAVPEKIKYPKQLQNILERAFSSNRFFRYTYLFEFGAYYAYIVFAKEVVSYFTDDLYDMYGFANAAASSVFKDLLIDKVVSNWMIFVCPSTDQNQ